MPVVIWLHPFAYNRGYSPTYEQSKVWDTVAAAGYAVIAYEQIGFGGRVREGGTAFYARNGNRGSLLGHMVSDVSAVVDFLMCHTSGLRDPMCGTDEGWGPVNLPQIDPSRIFVAGYSLGGSVGLHAAALDKRIAGVASFAGFTPMRTDASDRPTGGLRRLYEMFALAPRLAQFDADPSGVPCVATPLSLVHRDSCARPSLVHRD